MVAGDYIALGCFGITIIGGVGVVVKTVTSTFVRKDICKIIHTNVDNTLQEIKTDVKTLLKNGKSYEQ